MSQKAGKQRGAGSAGCRGGGAPGSSRRAGAGARGHGGSAWDGGWSPREAGPQPHASGSGRLPCAPRPLFAFGSPASPPSSSLGLVSRPLSSSAPKPPRPPPAGRLVNRWGLRGLEVANLSPGRHHREKQRSYDVLLEAGPSVAAQVMFRAGRLLTAGLSHAASPSLHPSVPGAPAPQAVTTKMPPATAGWSLGSKINPDGRPSP